MYKSLNLHLLNYIGLPELSGDATPTNAPVQNPNLVHAPVQTPNLVHAPVQNPNLLTAPVRNPNLVNEPVRKAEAEVAANDSKRLPVRVVVCIVFGATVAAFVVGVPLMKFWSSRASKNSVQPTSTDMTDH